MSWCSEWMRDWLRNGDRTQTELARLCAADPANVSRWMSDQSKPDREVMATLVSALDQAEAADLLVAWLRDSLPDGSDELVRIEPAKQTSTSGNSTLREEHLSAAGNPPAFPSGMSHELRERLVFFGRLAIRNPDIRKILDVCYQAARRSSGPEKKR